LTDSLRLGRFTVETTTKTTIQRWGNSLAARIQETFTQETALD
jgi:hypothetical protein